MKLAGFLFLIFGGVLVGLFFLYHLLLFLISGSPLLIKGGIFSLIIGVVILLISAFIDKNKDDKYEDIQQ